MTNDNLLYDPSGRFDHLDRSALLKILENSYDEIFVTDARGVVIYVNPVGESYYGLKTADVIGRKAGDLVDEGYYAPPIIHRVLEKKERVNLVQKTNIGKTLLITATPVFNKDGTLEMVVQNSRDVTGLEKIKQELENAQRLVQGYREEIQKQHLDELGAHGLVAHSPGFKKIIQMAGRVASVNSNVILLGDSGTGKGHLAQYIHQASQRKNGPFITINCAAIPAELIESELFGYGGGAFTGARREGRAGRLELANGGTLFLDELAEFPLHLQAKLLEAVQERQFIPVGGSKLKTVDIRIISATNRDLHTMVQNGTFRRDLYHRLKVIEIEMPPLRERGEDILPLLYYYVNLFDRQFGRHHQLDRKTVDLLLSYDWPGNIRELKHTVEYLTAMVENGKILPEHLPPNMYAAADPLDIPLPDPAAVGFDGALDEFARRLILNAQKKHKSSYKIARALNISQSKASRLIRRYMPRGVTGGVGPVV